MKKDKSTSLVIIGIMFSTLGLTIFNENQILQYISLGLGVLIGIYAAFKSDRDRKESAKNK
ncbi:hypothetical protein [Ekhidna sp.]